MEKHPKQHTHAKKNKKTTEHHGADPVESSAASDLSKMYHFEDDGDDVDMTKMDQDDARKRWKLFALLGVAAIGVIVALVYVLWFRPVGTSGDVDLTVTATSKVASGDVVTLDIQYRNNKNIAISNGVIEVFYPSGFTLQTASVYPVENTDDSQFAISTIEPGSSGKIRIVGQLVGTPEDKKEFSAQFTYRPENFSQDFQVASKATTIITSSTIEAELEIPDQVQSETDFEYTVTIKNTGKTDMKNVQLLMVAPDGYVFKSADPEPYSEKDTWLFEVIESGAEETVKITAAVDGKSGETLEFKAQIGLVELDNTFNIQTENTKTILIVNPSFDLTLELPEKIYPGDEVTIKATIKNTTGSTVKKITPRLVFGGGVFADTEKVFEEIPELENMGSKDFTYTGTVKRADAIKASELAVTLALPVVTVSGVEVTVDKKTEKKIRISSKPQATAIGRYFDAALKKIGNGPIPPTVGETTTYAIDFSATAMQNPLKNVTLTATLPAHVTWDRSENDGLTYDAKTRTVTFKTAELPAKATQTARFFVEITPVAADQDSLLVLVNEAIFGATDAYTNQALTENLPRITTDLPQDEGARGKGIVQ